MTAKLGTTQAPFQIQECTSDIGDPFSDLSAGIGELQFDLEQPRQINPELVPEEFDAAELVDIDESLAIISLQPLTSF